MTTQGRELPVVINLALAALFLSMLLFLYFLLPLWLLPHSLWWGLLALPLALTTTSYWALAHEAMHGTFHPARRVNEVTGRVMAILYGAPFAILRFGHMLHHRASRTVLDRSEVFDARRRSRHVAAAGHYFQIFGGLYLKELATTVLVFLPVPQLQTMVRRYLHHDSNDLPDMGELAVNKLLTGSRLWELRLDAALILLLFGISFALYGAQWYWLLAALLIRGLMISFFDNAYHYGTALERSRESFNLALTPFWSRLLLHFNLHHVHHRHPALPWTALPATYAEEGDCTEGGYLAVALRQLRGPIPLETLQPSAVA